MAEKIRSRENGVVVTEDVVDGRFVQRTYTEEEYKAKEGGTSKPVLAESPEPKAKKK